MQTILEAIPVEQWLLLIGGVLAFISTVAYGLWTLYKQEREAERKKDEARLDMHIKMFEARLEKQRIQQETQIMASQFEKDETLFNQETMTRFFRLLEETTKAQQSASDKRDEQHNQHMAEIAQVVKSLDGTTASQLELLKDGQESHQVLIIRQEKITAQNDVTHSKLSEISTDLSALATKLENMNVSRESDRKTLTDIQSSVLNLKELTETMNNRIITQPIPPLAEIEADVEISAVFHSAEITEDKKEFSEKSESEAKE